MEKQQENHYFLPLLKTMKKASKDLQINPISLIYPKDPKLAIQAILELGTKAEPIFSSDPAVFNLFHRINNLKTLQEKLQNTQGYSLRSLFSRRVINCKISQLAYRIEAEIQSHIDIKTIVQLVEELSEIKDDDDEKVNLLIDFENRVNQGFDRDFQELILRGKVFSVFEVILCDTMCSTQVQNQVALAVLALVKFNKDVFVGLVLMGSIIRALVLMGSCCSIQILSSFIRFIRTPLIDEMESNGEIPRIISLLRSENIRARVAAMNCILEIACFGRKEVIEAMIVEGLMKKFMDLQRLEGRRDLIDMGRSQKVGDECVCVKTELKLKSEEGILGEDFPFENCVARFVKQVQVGEGLEIKEKREFKLEMLSLVREASISEAESATIVAEILWCP